MTNRAIICGRLQALSIVALATAALSALAGCAGSVDNSVSESPYLYPQGGHVTRASWYGPGFNGRRTSSGEVFRQNDLTAASKTLPLGSYARVTNLDTGNSVTVRINDRGPFVRGRGIDLSRGAAEKVGIARAGVATVKVTPVGTAAADAPTPSANTAFPVETRSKVWSKRVRHRTYHRFRRRSIRYYSLNRIVSDPFGALR